MSTAAFFLFTAVHIYIFHVHRPKRRFRTMLVISFFALLSYTLGFFICANSGFSIWINAITPFMAVDFINGLFVYGFFLYFYAHLVIVFDRCVTVRMMVDIEESRDKRLSLDQIKSGYDLEDKFRYEVEDMVFLKRLVKEKNYIKNAPMGRTHAKVIEAVRKYMNIGGHQ